MLGRLLVVGVAWVAALALFAVLLQWSARAPRPIDRSRDGVSALARALNNLESPSSPLAGTWTVTRATSAFGALVIDAEAQQPSLALKIAAEMVEPVRDKYDEILIYIRPPGARAGSEVRRVQWTPGGGYVETTYSSAP